MRTIEEIKADIAAVKENLAEGCVNTDWCELELELRQALTSGITTDRLELLIEKQRSKEPKRSIYAFFCPDCGTMVGGVGEAVGGDCAKSFRHKFCHECGREIRWN